MNGQPVNPTATEGEIDDGGAAPLPDNQTSGMASGMPRLDNQTPPIADTSADLSRKFRSPENFGPRTIFSKRNWSGRTDFFKKIGPPKKILVHPQVQQKSSM